MKTATLPTARRPRSISYGSRSKISKSAATTSTSVLLPTDFSERSLEAIAFTVPLLRRWKAQLELHLVHVVEPEYPLVSMAAMPLILPEPSVGKRVRRHLKEVAEKYSLPVPGENIHVVRGRPFEEICGLARVRAIDLIVTSTRGHSGLKHLLLGSTAERIVRYSPCPVLVVHPPDGKRKTNRGPAKFGRILVPIDFSECSLKGLAYAKALAKQLGSKLILLSSVAFQYYVTSDEYARYDLPLLMQQAEKASRAQMRELIETTDWDGIEVVSSLQIGHAGQQICARALEHRADLIVTTTHGTTGFKHILVGSTAEYVVQHASCPVLVVPSHERPAFRATEQS
jgi:nucleotide-binding universal stress UspA family protein